MLSIICKYSIGSHYGFRFSLFCENLKGKLEGEKNGGIWDTAKKFEYEQVLESRVHLYNGNTLL